MTLRFRKRLAVQMLIPLIIQSILRDYLINLENKVTSVHCWNYSEESHA